jgi:hypothetical protein
MELGSYGLRWMSASKSFNFSVTGGKNKNKCFADWFSQNPSPIHRFLISGDKDIDLSCILLRNFYRRNDNVLLACPGKDHGYVSRGAFMAVVFNAQGEISYWKIFQFSS